MSFTLATNNGNTIDSVYTSIGFLNMIEMHVDYLRSHPDTTMISVDPQLAYKYEKNMIGLLNELGVLPRHHLVVMRVNGVIAPLQYQSTMVGLVIPSSDAIEGLKAIHITNYRMA